MKTSLLIQLCIAISLLNGCAWGKIRVTSDPPGATAYAGPSEVTWKSGSQGSKVIGKTPASAWLSGKWNLTGSGFAWVEWADGVKSEVKHGTKEHFHFVKTDYGNSSKSANTSSITDAIPMPSFETQPTEIILISPDVNRGIRITSNSSNKIKVAGFVKGSSKILSVWVNGDVTQQEAIEGGVRFSSRVSFKPGSNRITVKAIDQKGNLVEKSFTVRGKTEVVSSGKSAAQQEDILNIIGKYHALIVGINNYQHLPKLQTAMNDAQAIAALLQDKYGFKVRLLTNASRADILLAINAYRQTLTFYDNLLIYYAGHGWLDKDADQGYWLPVNATRENQVKWVSNSAITSEIRAIQAKHVMVVADSCYSGKITRGLHITQRLPDYLARISWKKARVVLSSGGLEPVMDSGGKGNHSVFASAFIETLNENKGGLDGTTLFTKIREKVGWNADQIPEYSNIHKAGHDGGDFIFIRSK